MTKKKSTFETLKELMADNDVYFSIPGESRLRGIIQILCEIIDKKESTDEI